MKDEKKPKIIAFILTYKCEGMVRRAYEKIPLDCVDRVFITDDGSPDQTVKEAQELGIEVYAHAPNRGYGGNLKEGLRRSFEMGADYAVEIHGDGAQFDPVSIRYAMPLMKQGYDLILGSRFRQKGQALKNGMPLIRFFANIFLSFLDRAILGLPLSDFHTGFRIYSRRLHERIPYLWNSEGVHFSFEIIAQAAYFRLKVGEVPVEADYISRHTSFGLSNAPGYALWTFKVLLEFALARGGVRFSRCFPSLGAANAGAGP